MRAHRLYPIAVVLGLLAPACASATTDVSANAKIMADVAPSCQVTNQQDLAFGTASMAMQSNGTVNITAAASAQGMLYVTCSFAYGYKLYAPASANANGTQRRMKAPSGNYFINYGISAASSGGEAVPTLASGATSATYARTGTGSQEWITIYGQVPVQTVGDTSGTAVVAPGAGTYSDTIAFTLSF